MHWQIVPTPVLRRASEPWPVGVSADATTIGGLLTTSRCLCHWCPQLNCGNQVIRAAERVPQCVDRGNPESPIKMGPVTLKTTRADVQIIKCRCGGCRLGGTVQEQWLIVMGEEGRFRSSIVCAKTLKDAWCARGAFKVLLQNPLCVQKGYCTTTNVQESATCRTHTMPCSMCQKANTAPGG